MKNSILLMKFIYSQFDALNYSSIGKVIFQVPLIKSVKKAA